MNSLSSSPSSDSSPRSQSLDSSPSSNASSSQTFSWRRTSHSKNAKIRGSMIGTKVEVIETEENWVLRYNKLLNAIINDPAVPKANKFKFKVEYPKLDPKKVYSELTVKRECQKLENEINALKTKPIKQRRNTLRGKVKSLRRNRTSTLDDLSRYEMNRQTSLLSDSVRKALEINPLEKEAKEAAIQKED